MPGLSPLRPLILVAAMTAGSLAAPWAIAAEPAPLQSLSVSSDQNHPPDERFMEAPSINPTTLDMKASVKAPVAAPNIGVQVGDAAPSYETLKDAAAAGVNPMAAPAITVGIDKTAPAASTLLGRLWPYLLAGLGFALFCGIAYVVFAPRLRATDAP